eukprot:411686-Hanusia_phi.AAC.2
MGRAALTSNRKLKRHYCTMIYHPWLVSELGTGESQCNPQYRVTTVADRLTRDRTHEIGIGPDITLYI